MLFASPVVAEPHTISGSVYSLETEHFLTGAHVILYEEGDSTIFRGTTTNVQGEFSFNQIPSGEYLLSVTFLGFKPQRRSIIVKDEDITEIAFALAEDEIEMDELRVEGRVPQMEIRGDTTVYNAAVYSTRSDAVAEVLIRRMPGFEILDGEIRVQGEVIVRVLVDGEDFFGDDPNIALRNLPASMIRHIQVFDRQSDQARFTGFADGNEKRTINIVTRDGLSQGRFGQLSGSLGTEDRYLGGGNANFFQGPRRVSEAGLSNNMNLQNFSPEDLAGIAASEGGSGGVGADNFRAGSQSGISQVHSIGINFVDRWNDRWRVNGSFFFNTSDNTNEQILERRYQEGSLEDQIYDEESWSSTGNYSHQFNGMLDYTIDNYRSIRIRPSANVHFHETTRPFDGTSLLDTSSTNGAATLLNATSNAYESDQYSYEIENSLLYRRSFDTAGRTFSLDLQTSVNQGDGELLQRGESYYYESVERIINEDQSSDIGTGTVSLSANMQFTETLGERIHLNFGYRPQWRQNYSDRDAFLRDEVSGLYNQLDSRLSSRYENHLWLHRLGGGIRHWSEQYHFNLSLDWQYTRLDGEQRLPGSRFSCLLQRCLSVC